MPTPFFVNESFEFIDNMFLHIYIYIYICIYIYVYVSHTYIPALQHVDMHIYIYIYMYRLVGVVGGWVVVVMYVYVCVPKTQTF